MNHFFGENFKQQRKKQDWTQEQIADMLGISSQAISKWENGTSLPDISLLPIIANLFHVSIDHLLGVDISKREENILDVLAQAQELCSKKRYGDAVSFLRNALLQYPAEPRIMYQLAWNLTGTIQEYPQNLTEAIGLYERILELCDKPNLRFKTIRDLVYRYLSAQEEEQAKRAVKILNIF